MQVDKEASSATASTSSAAAVVPGTRAIGARTVIRKASERVCDRITLKAIEQSFPDFVDRDAQFLKDLQQTTVEHLMQGFEQAWEELFNESDLKHFTARANAVDHIYAAASNRRARREVPQDAWKRGADPVIAIQAAVVPKLQANLDAVRQMKSDLANDAETRTQRILAMQNEIESLDDDVKNILNSIQQAKENLGSIDTDAVDKLREAILPLLSEDSL